MPDLKPEPQQVTATARELFVRSFAQRYGYESRDASELIRLAEACLAAAAIFETKAIR